MPCKQLDILHCKIVRNAIGSRRQVQKSASFGLFYPLIAVAVAAENNTLMLFYYAANKLMQVVFEILRALECIGILTQGFGDGGVYYNIRAGNRRR